MKRFVWLAIIAAGAAGFVSLSNAQEIKTLKLHPDALKDRSLQQQSVDLPPTMPSYSGGAGDRSAKLPTTGNAVGSGGTSTSQSKQKH